MNFTDLKVNRVAADLADVSHKYIIEFLTPTITPNFIDSAIAGGSRSAEYGTEKHPGQWVLKSSTTANSGYSVQVPYYSYPLSGKQKVTIIFKIPSSLANTTVRMGVHTSTDHTIPANGVYCKLDGTALSGNTVKASVQSTTPSTYTISPNTYYRLVIELNDNATSVKFTLYEDDSDVVLWTDILTTNIPTTIGGFTLNATNSDTVSTSLITIDYISVIIPNSRVV
jgi:hypothetical protein